MKRTLSVVSLGWLAAALVGTPAPNAAQQACVASLVDGAAVHAGVITGLIDPETDVVDGRFRLHVGEYRDLATETFQKILWTVPSTRRAGFELVVRGRTLFGHKRTFVQRFPRASADDKTLRYYPSTIVPPSAGCWRLTLKTGKLRNALTARVDAASLGLPRQNG